MNERGRPGRDQQGGFTLVELMIVMLITVILVTIAVPGFRDVLLRSRMTSKLNDFVMGMQTARSESVKYMRAATLCQSANGTSCNGTSWADGWLVWVDTNGDGSLTLDNSGTAAVDESEVFATGDGSAEFAFIADGVAGTADLDADASVVFRPDGTVVLPGTLGSGAIKVCLQQQVAGLVTVARSGRPTAAKLPDATGCP